MSLCFCVDCPLKERNAPEVAMLTVIRLKSHKPLAFPNLERLPSPSAASVLAHFHEYPIDSVKDDLAYCELPVLRVENDLNLGDVVIGSQCCRLVKLVSAFTLGVSSISQRHSKRVDIVLKPVNFGDF